MTTFTVDIAVLVGTRLALIKRTKAPFEDKWVLPGGHVEPNETNRAAAVRELEEEVGIKVSLERLRCLAFLDDPARDPRGLKVSTVYAVEVTDEEWLTAKAGSDARELSLHHLDDLKVEDIGFDHFTVIELLRRKS